MSYFKLNAYRNSPPEKNLRMGKFVRGLFAFIVAFAAAMCAPAATAQQQCSHGVIHDVGNVNRIFELCPPLASQAPNLERQLSDIAKSQSKQDETIKELRR